MLRHLPLLLLLPAVAFAQTPEVVAKVDAKLDAERAAQRNEDVEILRRLLNRAAGLPDQTATLPITAYDLRLSNATIQTTPAAKDKPLAAAVGPFDGVYLPGAGVVFTLHIQGGVPRTLHGDRIGLNSSCGACHTKQIHAATPTQPALLALGNCTSCHADVPKGEPMLSEWDRVKQDVRGGPPKPVEKPKDDKPKAAVCEPGNLQSLIAGVLAANAKNVRHLPEKEGVSVVMTFDGMAAADKQVFWQGAMLDDATGTFTPLTPPALPPAPKPVFTPDEEKALSLGDLHLKQGKHKEAANAYATALARFTDKQLKLSGLPNMTAEQRNQYADELQKGVRDVMKNYAKALLLSDQPEKAKRALELATEFVVLEVTPTTVPASSNAPAKLILTASKADIDTAKDATAFKKAVKAERLNFPK